MNSLLGFLPYLAPVAFAAAGELVSQRSGVVGIHTEGMMLGAALAAVAVGVRTGSPWLGLLAGIAGAMALMLVFALLTLGRGEDQVVVGTGVNLLALGGTAAAFRAEFGTSGALVSAPGFPKGFGGLDPVLLGGFALVALLGPMLSRTRFGLALRGAGESPEAVAAAGLSVRRVRLGALAIAAGFAGLGGAYLALGVAGSFAPGMTAGRGFVALALVSFGRWRLWPTVAGAALVGIGEAAQYRLQAMPGMAAVPPQVLLMLPYLLTLGVLVLAGPGSRAPLALGRAYER